MCVELRRTTYQCALSVVYTDNRSSTFANRCTMLAGEEGIEILDWRGGGGNSSSARGGGCDSSLAQEGGYDDGLERG